MDPDSDVEVLESQASAPSERKLQSKTNNNNNNNNSFPKVILRRMSEKEWIKIAKLETSESKKKSVKRCHDKDSEVEPLQNSNKKQKEVPNLFAEKDITEESKALKNIETKPMKGQVENSNKKHKEVPNIFVEKIITEDRKSHKNIEVEPLESWEKNSYKKQIETPSFFAPTSVAKSGKGSPSHDSDILILNSSPNHEPDENNHNNEEITLIKELPPLLHQDQLKREPTTISEEPINSNLEKIPDITNKNHVVDSPRLAQTHPDSPRKSHMSGSSSDGLKDNIKGSPNHSGFRLVESPTGHPPVLKPSTFINNKDCLKIQLKLALKKRLSEQVQNRMPASSAGQQAVRPTSSLGGEKAEVKPDISQKPETTTKYVDKATFMDESPLVTSSSGVSSSSATTVDVGTQVDEYLAPMTCSAQEKEASLEKDDEVTYKITRSTIACQTNTDGFIEVLEPECMFMAEKDEKKLMFLREMELMYYKEYMKVRSKCKELEASMTDNDKMSHSSGEAMSPKLNAPIPALRSTVLVSHRPLPTDNLYKELSPFPDRRQQPPPQLPVASAHLPIASMTYSEPSQRMVMTVPIANTMYSQNKTTKRPDMMPENRNLPFMSATKSPPNYEPATIQNLVPQEVLPQHQREEWAQESIAKALSRKRSAPCLPSSLYTTESFTKAVHATSLEGKKSNATRHTPNRPTIQPAQSLYESQVRTKAVIRPYQAQLGDIDPSKPMQRLPFSSFSAVIGQSNPITQQRNSMIQYHSQPVDKQPVDKQPLDKQPVEKASSLKTRAKRPKTIQGKSKQDERQGSNHTIQSYRKIIPNPDIPIKEARNPPNEKMGVEVTRINSIAERIQSGNDRMKSDNRRSNFVDNTSKPERGNNFVDNTLKPDCEKTRSDNRGNNFVGDTTKPDRENNFVADISKPDRRNNFVDDTLKPDGEINNSAWDENETNAERNNSTSGEDLMICSRCQNVAEYACSRCREVSPFRQRCDCSGQSVTDWEDIFEFKSQEIGQFWPFSANIETRIRPTVRQVGRWTDGWTDKHLIEMHRRI